MIRRFDVHQMYSVSEALMLYHGPVCLS